jgi:hypothetical protein
MIVAQPREIMSEVVQTDQGRYDLTQIRVHPRTAPAALKRIEPRVATAAGALLACLYSEIGTVNLILLLRRYDGLGALLAAREALVTDPDPFGVSEFALGVTADICVALPGLPPVAPAVCGPFFEVRTEVPRVGRLFHALAPWKAAARDSTGRAPIAGLHSIAGDAPCILHVWPGAGLDERATMPGAASDPWPRTGADDFVSCRTDVFRAAPFSPIR